MLAMTASPAFADEKPAGDSPTIDTAPAADAPAPDAEGGQLDDIVVTATKTETNLQKTPIAIAVLSSTALADRHVQSLYDLADGAVPSLRVATFEARQTALTIGIRGIVPLDANQPAREQGVGIYIDGVYLGRQHGLNAALFDVERIEVLKGPQGSLFGRNTEGGALSIVTKAPSGVFDLRATGGVSTYGGYNGDVHVDLPEFHDISVKLDGVIQHQDATIKDPLPGSTGWNYFHRRGGHAAVQWKPFDGFTAKFDYDNGYDANTAFYSQLLNYNPNHCVGGVSAAAQPQCVLPGSNTTSFSGAVKPLLPFVQVNGTSRMSVADVGVPQQPSIDKTHGYTLHLNLKAAPWIELRSITAWRGVSSIQWDNSGGAHRPPVIAATGGAFSRYSLADLYQHQFSQEFQAVGSVPHFDYAAGLYYFQESSNDDAATPSSNILNADGTISIADPCPANHAGSQPGCRSIDRASVASSKSYAVFGQVTYTPGILDEALHITAGGRYTHDHKLGQLVKLNNAIPITPLLLDQTTSRFNPMVTVAYDATSDINLYAKYSTGYRAGGASSRSLTYRSFGPEDVKAYEIGAKTEFLDHHVRLNLAAYMMDRKNSQIDFSNVQFDTDGKTSRNTIETVNAPGITKIRGIEADLTVNPVAGLTLTGGYAYTYTKIPPILNPFTNVVQNVYIVFTPRNAASGSLDYRLPVARAGADASVRLHLDANYSQSTQTFDQYAIHNDASFLVNGRLSLADIDPGWGGSKLTLSLWVRNLFDEQYVYRRDPSNSYGGLPPATTPGVSSVANILGDYGNFNAPRTMGIEASVKL